jgi:hypothetical protein
MTWTQRVKRCDHTDLGPSSAPGSLRMNAFSFFQVHVSSPFAGISRVKAFARKQGACFRQRGAALLIVLFFVVLLTILVAAFLAQSSLSRQIFASRAGQTQVDVLASDTIEFMKADLRQEIIAGSTNNSAAYDNSSLFSATNSSGTHINIYVPSTNLTVVPSRTGFVPGAATADPYANIVKISKNQTNFFGSAANPSAYNTNSYPSPNYASPSSSGDPSLNGRYIDNATTGWTTNGWDKPQLIDTATYTTSVLQSGHIPLPDWIYVTTNGRKVLSAPESDVVGRYAYVVYDEGGLLDINSAGCDVSKMSPLDAYDVARKGSLGLADLTQIPGLNSTIAQAVVAWRNHLTSSASYSGATANTYPTNAPVYLQYLVNGYLNNGFLKAAPGDQRFLSRQDLISYAPTLGIPAQSLAYLGTFTRTLNAPTWMPIDPPGAVFSSTNLPTSPLSFSYASSAELNSYPTGGPTISVANRDVVNVRWPKNVTITRPVLNDDTGNTGSSVLQEKVTFSEGDPVVQHRFPLSKIQLLLNPLAKTQVSTTVGTVAWAVRYYFGLKWVTTDGNLAEPHWQYQNAIQGMNEPGTTDGTYGGGGLKNLNSIHEVAALGTREPDFFEMLYAGKLKGSGVTVAGAGLYFDIGANIVDQFDPDDIPTVISAGHIWFGRENLPYIFQVLLWPYRPTSDLNRNTFEAYLVPELWNPHRNAATPSSAFTNLRMIVYQTRGGSPASAGPPVTWTNNTNTSPLGGTGDGGDIYAEFTGGSKGTAALYSTNYYETDGYNPATNAIPVSPAPTPGPSSGDGFNGPDLSLRVLSTASDNTKPGLVFNNSSSFQEPTILTPATATLTNDPTYSGSALNDGESVNRIGFYLGYTTNAPDQLITKAASPNAFPTNTTMQISSHTSACSIGYRMQYSTNSGVNWNTYEWISVDMSSANLQFANDFAGANGVTAQPCFSDKNGNDALHYFGAISTGLLDPRMNNDWLASALSGSGYSMSSWNAAVSGSPLGSGTQPTWRPNKDTSSGSTLAYKIGISPPNSIVYPAGAAVPGVTPAGANAGLYSENTGAQAYQNSVVFSLGTSGPNLVGDFVQRPGDGANGAYPMAKSNLQDRPMILNRPFLSVGELGYAYSGMEWKTLDFSSPQSGDSGLLDLFSLNDTENANQQSMISGIVNINTHNPAVLQSVISGGLINGLDTTGTTTITTADAQTMADAIVTETTVNRPLLNRAELATRVASLSAIKAALATDGLVTKDRREAVVRALAEPADTRTWNLLIDLVVQAGRYPPKAAALSQFDVQGERRYWLHLAIDRYTGKVVDEQLELVQDR